MIPGETTPAARRVGPLLALDPDDNPVLGEDFDQAGEVEISFNGSDWAAPDGTVGEIGDGYYYYECTEAEAVNPWIAVKIGVVCQQFTLREDVSSTDAGIAVGETTATLRRIGPLLALNAANQPVVGQTFEDPGEIEISINGSSWAAPGGTVSEISDGYYYYNATAGEVTSRGWVAVKLAIVVEEFTLRTDIVAASSGTPPVVTNLEPPDGQPILPDTPIQFDITDTAGFVLIIPMIVLDPYRLPEPVTNNLAEFNPLYAASTRATITNGYRYTLRRKGGWTTQPQLVIWAVDSAGEIYTL